ncbi:MAG TPA: hypothetical protein VFJ77_11960 [Gaiellaceae bacterium]|nr:hypothetical protein [Gaiellaceae bacterium]
MYDPGVDLHEWTSRMEALEEQLAENPAESLPELDDLVGGMLAEGGFDLDDPVGREGDEAEVVTEFLAAREITRASEAGSSELSPGDVAAAINGYRAVYDHLVAARSASDGDLDDAGEP